jgi:hypothetical protein
MRLEVLGKLKKFSDFTGNQTSENKEFMHKIIYWTYQ